MAQPGGALLYGALGATLWQSRPGLVSVLGDDYPAQVLEKLQQRGVDLGGVHPLGRSGVRTWLLYEGHVRRLIHRLGCPTHAEVSPGPELVPVEWSAAKAFHLARAFDVQRAMLTALRARAPAFVSIDPDQPVTEETLHEWREALADADAFFPGEDELQLEEAQTDPHRALPRLVSGRLRFVVFKRGAKGASSTTRPTGAFTPGTLGPLTSSIRPAQAMPLRSGSCSHTSSDFRSRCVCDEESSPQASPSKAGDLTHCSRPRARCRSPVSRVVRPWRAG